MRRWTTSTRFWERWEVGAEISPGIPEDQVACPEQAIEDVVFSDFSRMLTGCEGPDYGIRRLQVRVLFGAPLESNTYGRYLAGCSCSCILELAMVFRGSESVAPGVWKLMWLRALFFNCNVEV